MTDTKRRRGRRDEDAGERDEAELCEDLRRRAWAWLAPRSAPVTLEAAPAFVSPTEAQFTEPANDAPPVRARKRQRRELGQADEASGRTSPPRAVASFRRKAWWWLQPAMGAAPVEKLPDAGKRRRTKRDAPPDGVAELRRRAWWWFAPKTAVAESPSRAHPAELPGGEIVRAHLKGVLEAVIFASEHPLPAKELSRIAGADLKLVRALLTELVADYQSRGIRLDEIAGGFVFRTSPAFAPFVRAEVAKKPVRMSRAQIETLAIVAYRQPITRPEIDDVRGVDSGAVLKSLLERELVRIVGKKDEPGRPMLYGTTPGFLEFFGLKALSDLPTLREFTELSDESRRTYEREMGEDPEAAAGDAAALGGLMGGEGEVRTPAASPPEAEPPPASDGGTS